MDESGENFPPPPGPQPLHCAGGHVLAPNSAFCPYCGQPAVAPTPMPFAATPQKSNRRTWIIVGAAAVVLVAAVGIVLASSGSSNKSPATASGGTSSHVQLTTSQRAIARCSIAVAAGVDKMQTQGSGEAEVLAGKLGSTSFLDELIQYANTYLNAALQRLHPRQQALQQTVREIQYLCARPIVYLSSNQKKGTISSATAHADLRKYLVAVGVAAGVTGGVLVARSYFSSVTGFTGVTGIENVSGFTGLSGVSGFSAPSGTSNSSPGGFTGLTGTGGISGFTGSGGAGNTGSGFSDGGGDAGTT